MPLTIDLMENDIIGPAIKKGLERSREEGRQEGRVAGEQKLLRLQIAKRFGPIPQWADTRLASLSVTEIEALAERIFDVTSIENLFH